MTLEIVFMWIALTFYVVATVMFVYGVTLMKDAATRWAVVVSAAGLVPQVVALGVRWARLGHGPYIGYYEVANALTLCTVAFFVTAALREPRSRKASRPSMASRERRIETKKRRGALKRGRAREQD